MKTITRSRKSIYRSFIRMTLVMITGISLIILPSCQKDDNELVTDDSIQLKSSVLSSDESVYFGPVTFTRNTRAPQFETIYIENPYYNCYDGLFLKIQNGNDKKSRVSSAEIYIDGIQVAGPSDFSKNVTFITKPISGLKDKSLLEVKLNSAPGSFIDIWIEGNLNLETPLFTQIGPVVQDSDPPLLPMVSENGITGTWSPEIINTADAGTFTYTFTPAAGECAVTTTMVIEIINRGTVIDNEGNSYATIKIGTQWWMSENLAVTKYKNGDVIGTTTPASQDLTSVTEPKYQWAYNGDEGLVDTYGRLYTGYVITDSRGVCPDGWHVPSSDEWTTLYNYLVNNGYGYEGSGIDISKSMASMTGWLESTEPGTAGNNPASNNSSGFNGLPAGVRITTGTFQNLGSRAFWWSSTESVAGISYRRLIYNSPLLSQNIQDRKFANSVRCIKN